VGAPQRGKHPGAAACPAGQLCVRGTSAPFAPQSLPRPRSGPADRMARHQGLRSPRCAPHHRFGPARAGAAGMALHTRALLPQALQSGRRSRQQGRAARKGHCTQEGDGQLMLPGRKMPTGSRLLMPTNLAYSGPPISTCDVARRRGGQCLAGMPCVLGPTGESSGGTRHTQRSRTFYHCERTCDQAETDGYACTQGVPARHWRP